MFVVKRSEHNPILVPDKNHYWEAFAAFNLCPARKGRKIIGLYRAISARDALEEEKQISVIGAGESRDGIHFENRRPFITPEAEWEKYGCEDPRVTFFEGKYYIFYTALSRYPFSPEGIRVAVAVSKDLVKVSERHLVTPFNAKAMALFPERVNGKIVALFSFHTDTPPARTCFVMLDKIEDLWSESFWRKWEEKIDDYTLDLRRTEYDQIEVGAPPLKTKYGWLVVYSHIQNYYPNPHGLDKIFGVEALLLDRKDPRKITGRTTGPMLVPEELYERSGYVPNIVFPSGALIAKNILNVYYGAADTTSCLARVNLDDFAQSIHFGRKERFKFKRSLKNPILSPMKENNWESKAVLNPAAIALGGKIHLLYRAMGEDNTSVLGYAMTKNGSDILERSARPVYAPREDFENKKSAGGNSGCEDPRLSKIGNRIYMCYTAFDGAGPPRVAISSIAEKDFLAQKWNWEKPFLATPEGVDDKDACILPEKFSKGYFFLHRIGGEICGDYFPSLDPKKAVARKCISILGPRVNTWDSAKVGLSSVPIKTKYGWLMLYHGVSKSHSTYRIGCVLLDLKDPAIVLARSTEPILEPEEQYEKIGIVNNVVFPCGMIQKGKQLYIYYGGGDRVVGVATIELEILLKTLVHGTKL